MMFRNAKLPKKYFCTAYWSRVYARSDKCEITRVLIANTQYPLIAEVERLKEQFQHRMSGRRADAYHREWTEFYEAGIYSLPEQMEPPVAIPVKFD